MQLERIANKEYWSEDQRKKMCILVHSRTSLLDLNQEDNVSIKNTMFGCHGGCKTPQVVF